VPELKVINACKLFPSVREIHVAIGIEHYIHVPQVTLVPSLPQQQFSGPMAVEHLGEFVWQPLR
jgi:hypothetical protein